MTALSNDEGFSWRLVQYPAEDLVRRTGADVHPPLYYLLLKAWVAIRGTSPAALRGLSVVFGVLCVPLVYAVCREARALGRSSGTASLVPDKGGALFSALLLTLHLSQVIPSRTARMYSLGIFLAGLTSWLLLRALRTHQGQALWWCTYGIMVAAFCYTHNYALFTVFAQGIFVVILLLARGRGTASGNAGTWAAGLLFAGTIALLAYGPWLPVLWAQMHTFREGYWIPAISAREFERIVFHWGTGLDYQGTMISRVWLGGLGAYVVWMVWRGGLVGQFFLLQAAVPWGISVALSLLSGSSILVERYLAFAHFFLIGFWGVVWCRVPGLPGRLLLVCLLGTPCLHGLTSAARALPEPPPALVGVVDFLKIHYQGEDTIRVNVPAEVNLLRYYATQAGFTSIRVHCVIDRFVGGGHITHVAALPSDDILLPDQQPDAPTLRRIWRATPSHAIGWPPQPGMRITMTRIFEGGGSQYTLILLERTQ